MGDDVTGEDALLARLPTVYAVALRLRGTGASDVAIAEVLGTNADDVPALLDIGHRKLEELRRTHDAD